MDDKMTRVNGGRVAFSDIERQDLLQKISDTKRELKSFSIINHSLDAAKENDLQVKFEMINKKLQKYYSQYEAGLPRYFLSRCPFTGVPIQLSIDTMGIDGLWWDYEAAVRPIEVLPLSVFAFTGAINIKSEIPKVPFLCKPGPGVPFVIPRLLINPEIKAVISTIKIGNITAWPIFYFAENIPSNLIRINDWGRDYYMAETVNYEGYAMQTYDYYIDYDFNLEFYIRTGRLLWIEPNDDEMKLNSTVSDCPYIGLKGNQYPIALYNGEMWNSLLDNESVEEIKQKLKSTGGIQ